MESMDGLTWVMVLVTATLATATGTSHTHQVVEEFLRGLFEDELKRSTYIFREILQHVHHWRNVGCFTSITRRAERSYRILSQNGGVVMDWTIDHDEIIRLLRWLSIGESLKFVTTSDGTCSFATILCDIGLQ
jgi:hypothetical protein